MKNRLCYLLMCFLLISVSVFAEEGDIKVEVKDNKITVSGETNSAFETVSMVFIPQGVPEAVGNIVAISEVRSDENKKFVDVINCEGEGSRWTDNVYILQYKIGNGAKKSKQFVYYSENGKNTAISNFISNATVRLSYLNENSMEFKIFSDLGIMVDKLPEGSKNSFLSFISDGLSVSMDENAFIEHMNKGIVTVLANSANRLEASVLSNAYKDFAQKDEIHRNWIIDAIFVNKPYSSVQDFQKKYEKINVLCEINYTRADQILEMLNSGLEKLEISDTAAYKNYTGLSLLKRGKACDFLQSDLSLHDVKKVSDFVSLLQQSITKANADSSVQEIPTVPSGGGGGGSFGGVATNVTKIMPGIATKGFSDISSVQWAEKAINTLYSKGIISGVGEGRFEPHRNITREEFVTMLVKMLNLSYEGEKLPFRDIEQDKWYYEYVKLAYANGIVNGISMDSFGIGKNITREEMSVMVYNALNGRLKTEREYSGFTDEDTISEYAKDAVKTLFETNIVSGMEDNSFKPKANATRAEAAKMLYNLIGEE